MLMISVDEVMDILEEYAVCTPDEEKSLIHRINQASMFIDNIGTVSKWISVKDRLPEQYTDVIVLYDFGRVGVNWTNKENEFIEHPDCKVTHWMPLPEPPKEQNNE